MPYLSAKISTLLLVTSLTAASAADQNVWDECTHTRDTDASIAACSKIVKTTDEAASNRAIAYYARAGAYKAKGDKDQAIADYTKAIEANSHYADAYAARGIIYQIIGKNDDAISDYSKAIEIDPRKADADVGRGMVYRFKGDTDRAIAGYTQAIAILCATRSPISTVIAPSKSGVSTIGRSASAARNSQSQQSFRS
jgi:tetratricopeptide (TPR) repeat protein